MKSTVPTLRYLHIWLIAANNFSSIIFPTKSPVPKGGSFGNYTGHFLDPHCYQVMSELMRLKSTHIFFGGFHCIWKGFCWRFWGLNNGVKVRKICFCLKHVVKPLSSYVSWTFITCFSLDCLVEHCHNKSIQILSYFPMAKDFHVHVQRFFSFSDGKMSKSWTPRYPKAFVWLVASWQEWLRWEMLRSRDVWM